MHSDKFAEIGDRQGSIYFDLPPVVQEIAGAAAAMRQVWWAMERAATRAQAGVHEQYESLVVLELQAYRSWQEVEQTAEEVLAWINRDQVGVPTIPDESQPDSWTAVTDIMTRRTGGH